MSATVKITVARFLPSSRGGSWNEIGKHGLAAVTISALTSATRLRSTARSQKGRFYGHFSRVVVSDLWSLLGDIASSAFFARLSPAAKIPFQTRIGQADRKSARGEFSANRERD